MNAEVFLNSEKCFELAVSSTVRKFALEIIQYLSHYPTLLLLLWAQPGISLDLSEPQFPPWKERFLLTVSSSSGSCPSGVHCIEYASLMKKRKVYEI